MYGPLRAFERHARGVSATAVFEIVYLLNGETLPPFISTAAVDALPFKVGTLDGAEWVVTEHEGGTFSEWRSASDKGLEGDNFRLEVDGTFVTRLEQIGDAVGSLPEPFRAAALERVKGFVDQRWKDFKTAAAVEKLLGGKGVRRGLIPKKRTVKP